MKPRVLNAWSQVVSREVSRLCIESTAPPHPIEMTGPFPLGTAGAGRPAGETGTDYVFRIILSGVGLTMAEDEILVADGLVRKVCVMRGLGTSCDRAGRDCVTLDVVLEHPVAPTLAFVPGLPFRTDFDFPRHPLTGLFAGRTIAIDPGHGGKDAGVRGPINLLEKNVALDIAMELQSLLTACGATPLMSREDDSYVDPQGWILAVSSAHPNALVEIHASGGKDPMSRLYHAYARRGSRQSQAMAGEVAAALTERMGITFPGVEEADFAAIPLYPAMRVEPVCLTHFVDEANFRAPLYKKRIAQAIFNGLSRYLSSTCKGAHRACVLMER